MAASKLNDSPTDYDSDSITSENQPLNPFLVDFYLVTGGATSGTSGIITKVLYFTEKTVTPFLTSIPRR